MKYNFFSIFSNEFHDLKRALTNSKKKKNFMLWTLTKKATTRKKISPLIHENWKINFFQFLATNFTILSELSQIFFHPKKKKNFSCTIVKKSYNSKKNFTTYTWKIIFFLFLATIFTIWSELSPPKKNHEKKLVHHENFWSSLIQERSTIYLT